MPNFTALLPTFSGYAQTQTTPSPTPKSPFSWPDFENGQNELLPGQNGPQCPPSGQNVWKVGKPFLEVGKKKLFIKQYIYLLWELSELSPSRLRDLDCATGSLTISQMTRTWLEWLHGTPGQYHWVVTGTIIHYNISCHVCKIYCGCPAKRSSQDKFLVTDSCLHSSSTGL